MNAGSPVEMLDPGTPTLAERATAILRDEIANGALANIPAARQVWPAASHLQLLGGMELKEPGIVCELGVADVARSIAFYEKLGFETVEVEPAGESFSWAELSFHGSRLMLQEISALADHLPGIGRQLAKPTHAVVLRVGSMDDVKALHGRLDVLGIDGQTGLRRTGYGTTEFSIVDPDGYVLLIAGF